MLKSIVDYVNYHYQLCDNIDSEFLSQDQKANECYIKSWLIYKYLYEIFYRSNITLMEIMIEMDVTDFLFMSNSPVLKNHIIFHQAFKSFWKRYKKGRRNVYVFDTTLRSPFLGFVTGIVYWFFHEGVV